MQDQLIILPQTHVFEIKSFEFTILFQKKVLILNLNSPKYQKMYTKRYQFGTLPQEVKQNFETLEYFSEQLIISAQQNRLDITEDGKILMNYEIQKRGRIISLKCTLFTQEVSFSEFYLARKETDKLKKEVQALKQLILDSYQKSTCSDDSTQLKLQFQPPQKTIKSDNLQKKIIKIMKEQEKMENTIKAQQLMINHQDNLLKAQQAQINELIRNNKEVMHAESIQMLKSVKYESQMAIFSQNLYERFVFKVDTAIGFSEGFNTNNGDVITRNTRIFSKGHNWAQIVSNKPLPENTISFFNFKLLKSKNNFIYFGILSEDHQREAYTTWYHEGNVCISLYTNRIFQNGKEASLKLPTLQPKGIVSVVIDMLNKKVSWYYNKSIFLGSSNFCSNFEGRQLYPFIQMHDLDDQIQLNIS